MKRKQLIATLAVAIICLAATPAGAEAQTSQTAAAATAAPTAQQNLPVREAPLSLRTNLLLWAFGSPSLGIDLTLGTRYQIGLDGSYGNWPLSHTSHAARLSTAALQLRRYFRPFSRPHHGRAGYTSPSRGAYLGIDLRYTHFNEQLLSAANPGREGDLLSAGILAGYSFALDPAGHWALDAAFALGMQHYKYDRYTWYPPAGQNRLLGTRTGNRFTLTALQAALVYRF